MGSGAGAQNAPVGTAPVLVRRYAVGEPVVYRMEGLNRSPQRTFRYSAVATGVVKVDDSGGFVEEFAWSKFQLNGNDFTLTPASEDFRERLSLAPGFKLTVPALSKVQPILIGPITDLLTFYADVQLAYRQAGLAKPGDRVYFQHGTPNSWADGTYTLAGEDSIDFDMTLVSVDLAAQTARLVVRHVPPTQPRIELLADWMKVPVGKAQNNWVQLQKTSDGKYAASIGEETFEADIQLSLASGKISSAKLENPVLVEERDCDDAALTHCAQPTRYQIERKISVEAVAAP